jgi:hypothetical protein
MTVMARTKRSETTSIYRLKITLRDTKPPIWRRIEVPGNTRLDHLHLMIQAAMGWYNCHLHSFTIDGQDYGMHDPDFDIEYENEKKFRLDEVVAREKTKFLYTYDFGDNWEHAVLVEKIAPPESGVKYPRCLAGARACPPEDVGSTWGYVNFLQALRDPKHEEHEMYVEWIGGQFDSEAFDPNESDKAVKNYKAVQADFA